MTVGQYILSAIICTGIAYAANFAGTLMTTVIGFFTGNTVKNEISMMVTSMSPWSVLFYTVLCAPVMEEFVFRKLIVDRAVRYGQGVAVVISGLMFGLFHGNLNQFVYAATIGAFLAYLYVRTGNLKITISLHMLFNFIGGFVPSMLLRKIDMGEYLALAGAAPGDGSVSEMLWLVVLVVFELFVIGITIAGVVLFIVFAAMRKFVLSPGQTSIPKQVKLSIALGNMGMAVFCLFWIIQIVCQLFA